MVSFFSNLTEIDDRISTVERKTQNQTGVSGTTTFSGDVVGGAFKVSGQTGFLKSNGNIDNNTYLTTGDASSTYLAKTGGSIGNNYITTTQTTFNASGQLVPKTYVDTALTPYITSTTANNTFLPFTGGSIANNYITTTQTVFNDSTQLVPKTYVDTAIGIGTNNRTMDKLIYWS